MRFGHLEETEYSLKQKELLNVVAIISKEDPEKIKLPSWLPFSQQFLGGKVKGNEYQMMLPIRDIITGEWMGGYYAQVLTPVEIPDLSYTYGTRLFKYKDIDQIQSIIDKLRAVRFSRRAIAILWIPTEDYDSQHPPCLDLIQAKIRENKLFLTAYFRSHDIFGAWPQNIFALRKLQKYIAEQVNSVELGDLIVISQSAHIYQDSWEDAKRITAKYYPKYVKSARFERDPRGSFVMRIERPNIVVDHYTHEGEHINTFRGRRADTLIGRITPFISQLSHAVYLGSELQKAEFALKLNINYVQDIPFDLKQIETILSEEE
jgi:thymidylate synthase